MVFSKQDLIVVFCSPTKYGIYTYMYNFHTKLDTLGHSVSQVESMNYMPMIKQQTCLRYLLSKTPADKYVCDVPNANVLISQGICLLI